MQITATINQINEIGYVGEHYANDFLVDVSNVATGTMIAEYQNIKGDKFVSGTLTKNGNNAIVPLPESVMRYAGTVYIQVVSSVYDGDDITQIDKSDRFECIVKDSVQGDDTEWHDNVDGLLLQLNETLATLQQSNYIPCYTAFPDNPSEGDIIYLTDRAVTSLDHYGFSAETFISNYTHTANLPITIAVDINLNTAPILDDTVTSFYVLSPFSRVTEDTALIMYGTLDGLCDKCAFFYDKEGGMDSGEDISLCYASAGTVLDGTTTVPTTGWYKIIESDLENDLQLVPITEVSQTEIDYARIYNANVYDMYYTTSESTFIPVTDAVFAKMAVPVDVILNSGIYQYSNNKWIDLLYHGDTVRYVEDTYNSRYL